MSDERGPEELRALATRLLADDWGESSDSAIRYGNDAKEMSELWEAERRAADALAEAVQEGHDADWRINVTGRIKVATALGAYRRVRHGE